MRYHINDNGEAGVCSAEKGQCPFGGEANHYSSAKVARAVYEVSMSDYGLPGHRKTGSLTSADQLLEEAQLHDPLPYVAEEDLDPNNLSVTTPASRFGFKTWADGTDLVPHQSDNFWKAYEEELVAVEEVKIYSNQPMLRYGAVRHYMESPEEPLDMYTDEEGIAVKAVRLESGAIFIQQGNHRTAAAILGKRKLLMVLAPEKEARAHELALLQGTGKQL